jgi:hypothetical protein
MDEAGRRRPRGRRKEAGSTRFELITANAEEGEPALARRRSWIGAQNDGDREHAYGFRIETLDYPGWLVMVDLADNPMENAPFDCRPPLPAASRRRHGTISAAPERFGRSISLRRLAVTG